MNVQTNNITDAVKHIETMQPSKRQEVFQFIDFLLMRNEDGVQVEQTDMRKKKRPLGLAKGKGSFEMADDFKMTAEELVSQDDMETPMTKASTADKKAMLEQLLGCMQGVQIDDPKQAHHEHLNDKYAEYFQAQYETKRDSKQDAV